MQKYPKKNQRSSQFNSLIEVVGINSEHTTTVLFFNDKNCDEIWDSLSAYTDRDAPTNAKKTFLKLLIYEQASGELFNVLKPIDLGTKNLNLEV